MVRLRAGALSLALGVLAFAPGGASAANALNLTTSPLPINLVVDPGHSVTTDLRIKSGEPETVKLKVSLMKFGAFGDTGQPVLEQRGPGDDYFDWVKFDKTTFDAPPNVWEDVKMTVNVPKDGADGYYYAVVFNRVGDDTTQPAKVGLQGGTAILVLLDAHVPGEVRKLDLTSFEVVHRVFEFLPAAFNVKFHNSGNVHVVPHGNIFIQQNGKTVATLGLNGAAGNVLPNSNRIYEVDWRDGWPHFEDVVVDGKVQLTKSGGKKEQLVFSNGEVDQNGQPINQGDPPHLRFGRYSAHLFAVYDNGGHDVPIESDVSFWVVPWRFLLVLLALLLLAGFGVYAAARGAFRGAARVAGGGRRKRR
jgi:hypothetical protein